MTSSPCSTRTVPPIQVRYRGSWKRSCAGADFAKGTRFAAGGGRSDITWLRRLGNDCLTGVFNLLYGRRYSDLCYGYNVFWRRCLPVLGLDAATPGPSGGAKLWGDGFEIETLIHVRVALAGPRARGLVSGRLRGARPPMRLRFEPYGPGLERRSSLPLRPRAISPSALPRRQ